MTDSPTKTAEQIVARVYQETWEKWQQTSAPYQYGFPLFRDHLAYEAGKALRAHGLLVSDAPSEEQMGKSKYISPALPGMIRSLWKSDPSEASVRTALKLAGDLIQELIDIRAAGVGSPVPVQVDEAKLASVIRDSYANEQGLKIRDDLRTAKAISEWLRSGAQ